MAGRLGSQRTYLVFQNPPHGLDAGLFNYSSRSRGSICNKLHQERSLNPKTTMALCRVIFTLMKVEQVVEIND